MKYAQLGGSVSSSLAKNKSGQRTNLIAGSRWGRNSSVAALTVKNQNLHSTTLTERLLLALAIVLLPLQDHMSPVGGFSIVFIMLILLGG